MRATASALALLACSQDASASSLRQLLRAPRRIAPGGKRHAGARAPPAQKKCNANGGTSVALVAESESSFSSARAIYYDGFSRYGCEKDESPAEQRIYFKDHACGPELKSCRLLELGMTPRLCFDFCRADESARFFGIEYGRDCYCTGYVTARSTGGGDCNRPCAGDTKEMCGGDKKSSVFEMHMCGDSAAEAETAQALASDATSAANAFIEAAKSTTTKVHALVDVWKLSVCSVKPEGERACAWPRVWLAQAAEVEAASAETGHLETVLAERGSEISAALQAVEDLGDEVNATQASALEAATVALRDAAVKVEGSTATSQMALAKLTGPLAGGAPLASFASVFTALGDVENGWHGLCALKPIKGQSFAAVALDDPSVCGNYCLGLSTGLDACVAFNYQYRDGLAACQLLRAEGITHPKTMMSAGVPIFEVSGDKREEMGIASLGCYASGSFLHGHPKGPLKADVIREVTVA